MCLCLNFPNLTPLDPMFLMGLGRNGEVESAGPLLYFLCISDFTLIANERLSPENFKVLCSSVHEGVLFCF